VISEISPQGRDDILIDEKRQTTVISSRMEWNGM